jgi:hypothetical protein
VKADEAHFRFAFPFPHLDVPKVHFPAQAANLPVLPDLLGLRARGNKEIWTAQGLRASDQENPPLPSIEPGRL